MPENITLTSFSILFSRYKGELETQLKGIAALSSIEDGDRILIAEGCTHHRQCGDIGTCKMPEWIRNYTGKKPVFEFTSGTEFPDDVSSYKMVVHCGGCMLNEREMKYRIACCQDQGVPITNTESDRTGDRYSETKPRAFPGDAEINLRLLHNQFNFLILTFLCYTVSAYLCYICN